MTQLNLDRTLATDPYKPAFVAPDVARLTANNPGPMTFVGTNSYVVGRDRLVVIDPGPDDETHLQALINFIDGRALDAILVTHTHKDHSPLARALKAQTGAPILGAGSHHFARAFQAGDAAVDAAVDEDYLPDQVLADGDTLNLAGHGFTVVATPGHTMNHLCFAMPDQGILFSGDHVMAWSTTLVAPPDGAMTPYLDSLHTLLARPETHYLPGHGTHIPNGKAFVEGLLAHRMDRERAVLDVLARGPCSVHGLVNALYNGLDPRLQRAARLSVLAHLERLDQLGQVTVHIDHGEQAWQLTI